MGLPRTFVGFSSTDIKSYWLMLAWKENERIDFDFADCQLDKEIRSTDEAYIKSIVRKRIQTAGTYAMLIGDDTRSKPKYVRWEAEMAVEKGCSIIGINLDGSLRINQAKCPPIIRDIGAIFIPFSPKIVAYAIEHYKMHDDNRNYEYTSEIYKKLAYAA